MKNTPPSPKDILELLLTDGAIPAGIEQEQFMRARALARSPQAAEAAAVEGLPDELALAVLESAVRSRDAQLPQALAESRKPLAKAAKKALYQLRSLGVAVPERRIESAPTPPVPPAPQTEELPSLLSAVSGMGEQAVVIPRTVRGGGLEILQIVASDEKGVTHLEQGDTSRSAYRRQLRQIHEGRAAPAVEINQSQAARILADAAALNLETGTPLPDGADIALRHLGVSPQRAEVVIPAPEPEDQRFATEGAELHREPEIQAWLPPEEQIRLLAAKMDQIFHSPLQLSEAQRSEQIVNLFQSAAREFFTPQMRKLYAGRLWRMADFFEQLGREKPAKIARAEARRLFHHAPEPFSRFAEFLFEKVLLLSQRAQAQATAQSRPEPGLVGQSGPAPERPSEHRSPGGLILP
jgi:hypothetical protein